MDPLAGSQWSASDTVAGFAKSAPNAVLMTFAKEELRRPGHSRALDLGCGAGRNALPIAQLDWKVVGVDLSWPMLVAAATRVREDGLDDRLRLMLAPMDYLPARDRSFDLVIAHGIWNLARSTTEFRSAVAEAARVAAAGAALFVFTFSRHTLPPAAAPVPGEAFVFTQFSGQPQCFVTREQLLEELGQVGFVLDETIPMSEHNLPAAGAIHAVRAPVIFEAAFRYMGA